MRTQFKNAFNSLILFVVSITLAFDSMAAEPPSPGVTDSEILLGQSLGLTGQSSNTYIKYGEGSRLYFEKINAEGGVFGRKIKVITYDDGYEPKRTVENVKTLINKEKIFALFKICGTPTLKAILPMIDAEDIPVLSPSSGAQFIRTPPLRNIFMLRGGTYQEGEEIVNFLITHMKIKKIALFYQDDAFGNEGRNGTIKALHKFGLVPVAQAPYKRNSPDFSKAFADIQLANPEAVILWSVTEAGTEFIKMANKAGLKAIIVGNSALATNEFAQILSNGFVSMVIPLPYDQRYKIGKEYVETTTKAGIIPDPSSFQAYLDAAMFVEALRRNGKNLTRESLRNTFETKMASFDLGGLAMGFSKLKHQGLSEVFIGKIQHGRFIPIDFKHAKKQPEN